MSDPNLPDVPSPDAPREPLITVGGVTTVITTLLVLLVAFGVPLSEDQKVGILGFLAAVVPLAVAWIGRAKVYAPATVARLVARARAERSG